jgi:hypothetical protein
MFSKSLRLGGMLLALSPVATARAETLLGAVTSVSGDALEMRCKVERQVTSRVVTLTKDTQYIRWITHQPWQQSTVADRSLLKAGRCVAVELKAGDLRVAKLVRINTDEVGTIYYPCRNLQ